MQENYDRTFVDKVYNSPQLTASEVISGLRPSRDSTIRVQYSDLASFKAAAKLLGIMDDVKVNTMLKPSHPSSAVNQSPYPNLPLLVARINTK